MEIVKTAVIFLFFCSLKVSAKNITWPEAVQLVQSNNLEFQAALLNYESTYALELSSQSGYYPKLSVSAADTKTGNKTTTESDSYSAQLNLSQNIFSGFSDLSKSKQSKANSVQAQALFISTKAKLSSQLKQALAAFTFSIENQKLSAEIVKRRNDNLKIVDLRFQSGRENKGSVLLSKAYVNQANYDLLTASHDAEAAIEDLTRFLGLKEEEQIIFSDSIPQLNRSVQKPDFKKISLQTPDVLALAAQEQASQASVEIAKSNFFPSLDLSGSYGYLDSVFFPKQDRWAMGITLSLPLFDGGRDYSSVKSASYKTQSYAKQKEDLIQKTIISLKQTYFDFQAAIEKELLDESFRKASLLVEQIARSKYNNGLATFDEWDRAESDLISRERTMLSSQRDRIVKEALWEQAQGVGVFQ